MNIGYAQLPDEEQEKDRVVARALLQALKGQQDVAEESKGLWANIHAKQNRIKHGSGERMRKPGSKGAPTKANFKSASKTESVEETTGDPKFDKMLKDITGKKVVTKQQKADTKQQSRDAFSSMFGGGNPADSLGIRKKGVSETTGDTSFDSMMGKIVKGARYKGAAADQRADTAYGSMMNNITKNAADVAKPSANSKFEQVYSAVERILLSNNVHWDIDDDILDALKKLKIKASDALMQKLERELINRVSDALQYYDDSDLAEQAVSEDSDPCWDNYKQVGMKKKNGKKVPNCVPKEGVAEGSSESKSNVTSVITDFYKTQLSQSKPGKVENYNSKAKELLSQATGKQRAKVLTMLKAGSKNPYLQGVIITIVGSIVSGAVIKHFGSMGLSPQQFNMILQGSMNSVIPTLAAKLHGMSWSDAIKTGLASVAVGVSSAGIMENNAEYDDESGMAHTNLHTIIRAAEGLLDTIDDNENLPEWVQEKIANVEGMIVSSWDYLKSQEEQGIDPQVDESNWLQEELNKLDEVAAWQKKSGKNKTGGLNQKGVNSYRREHPGSKLQTAVTTKPSKLKPGSKAAKRRKSFCARMSGVKGPMKKDGKPTRKALALRKWNC
jgi:hypothetical protein